MGKKTRDKLKWTQKVVKGLFCEKKGIFGKEFYVWPGVAKIKMNLIKLMSKLMQS